MSDFHNNLYHYLHDWMQKNPCKRKFGSDNEAERQARCARIARDLRLREDEAGHPARESAFSSWLLRHPFTAQQVEMDVIHIGMRR